MCRNYYKKFSNTGFLSVLLKCLLHHFNWNKMNTKGKEKDIVLKLFMYTNKLYKSKTQSKKLLQTKSFLQCFYIIFINKAHLYP